MGSSNPVKKITEGAKDLYGSVKEDPMGSLLSAAILGTSGFNETYKTGVRVRDDQRDQAAGMAKTEQDRMRAESARDSTRAIDRSVKDLDPVALERRRRAAVANNQGRNGTILTSGASLGSADVARKTLLGM